MSPKSRPMILLIVINLLLALGLVGQGVLARGDTSAPAAPQAALDSAFTYQGQLSNAGGPITGTCDLQFALWDDPSAGSQLGSTLTQSAVAVADGLFTVQLDFGGAAFSGQARWLAVAVRCPAGGGAYTALAGRQPLTAAPYALHSASTGALQGYSLSTIAPAIGDTLTWSGTAWTPSAPAARKPYYPLGLPQVLDLAEADSSLKSFLGGFTDGRYGYLAQRDKIVRFDLLDYTSAGVTSLNLTTIDPDLKGFLGGFTDGRYGYFVPNFANGSHQGKFVRIDLQNFSLGGVTVLDLTSVNPGLKGFLGGFTDGRYGYLVPRDDENGRHGRAVRVDLSTFTAGGVTMLNLETVDPDLKGFDGGFTDGRYGYYVPYETGTANSGKIARVDLQNFTTSGVTTLDLATVDSTLRAFNGGFTDGRYGYFVPYGNSNPSGKIARVDLQNFTASGVSALDLAAINPALKGFTGGFTDGRYGYFVPSYNTNYHGNMARVDLQNFAADGVSLLDLSTVDSELRGFGGGFSDGRYGYLIPDRNPSGPFGKVVRFQMMFGGGL